MVGSNIFNVLGVLGITAIVTPVPVDLETLRFDMWIMIGTAFLLIPYALRRRTVGRGGGVTFIFLYCGYVTAELLHVPNWVVRNWPL